MQYFWSALVAIPVEVAVVEEGLQWVAAAEKENMHVSLRLRKFVADSF